jgi:energy-coupling factor transporter ATP-binding protein EcfA2
MNLFSTLARQKNRPVILVTHDEELAKAYCDRILRCTENGIEDVTPRPALPELPPPPAPPLPRPTARTTRRVQLVPNGRTGEVRVRLVLRDQENGLTRRKEERP